MNFMAPKGKILIIGGKEDRSDTDVEMKETNRDYSPHEILKNLAQSKDDRIEIITTATSDPEDMRKTYTETFTEIGYINFGFLDIDSDSNSDEAECVKRIESAKTVFFTGGDQDKICNALKGKAINKLLKEKYNTENDFIIAGTSAGAMCIPETMISEAENGEAIVENDICLDPGLGFIGNCIVDTHFVHRGRFGRLAHAVMLNQQCWGIGLGEDTALLIEEGNNAICKGSGMVLVIDGKEIKQTNVDFVEKGFPVYAENLKVHILTDGCCINLDNGKMTGVEK